MSTVKVAVTIEENLLAALDREVGCGRFANRSKAVQQAVSEILERLGRGQLARECAKLDVAGERAMADEGLGRDIKEWPEY